MQGWAKQAQATGVALLLVLAGLVRGQDKPAVAEPLADLPPRLSVEGCSTANPMPEERHWPEMWGLGGLRFIVSGDKMAPNGDVYNPLFSIDLDLNFGLLANKKLYLYTLASFWGQRAATDVTQSSWDFSKRQFDFTLGAAYNYWGPLEARFFAYSMNNLNRGASLRTPYGYNDGLGVENRYYLPSDDIYDLPRLNFVSLGYFPSKAITGADGAMFHPSLFARAYLTYEFVPHKYYVYADTQFITQEPVKAKLLWFDDGIAARPFDRLGGLEFRFGVENTWDVQVQNVRTLLYVGGRFVF
jgi:hypothetical protein